MLAATLVEYGVTEPVDVAYRDVWHRIEQNNESLAVVDALRRNGYGDTSCCSYDLGVAKPDPAFFTEAARRIGAEPSTILFIDDSERNVEGALTAELKALVWDIERGHDALVQLLATYGVDTRLTS